MGMGWGKGVERGQSCWQQSCVLARVSQCAWRAGAAGRQWGQSRKDAHVWVQLGTWLSLYYLRINLC